MSASERPFRPTATAVPTLSVLSDDRGAVICEFCEIADRPLSRLRGLLGRRGLEPDSGLLLKPSNSIHTFFMRFPIDVVFLDAELRVLKVRNRMGPWRVAGAWGARCVLELSAGEAERRGVAPGERLYVMPVPGAVAAPTGAEAMIGNNGDGSN
jgi:uncharacterized membrane protein (UPF0127 family)